MIILIDGYNLLRQKYSVAEIETKEKKHFLSLLAQYAYQKKYSLLVVFDGGSSKYPQKEHYEGIEIIYAGYQQSADDVIKEYVIKNHTQEILVVSNDRKLCDSLPKSTTCISTTQFMNIFDKKPEKAESQQYSIRKTAQESTSDIDELMKKAAQLPLSKQVTEYKKQPQKMQKLKKEERKIIRKIKKL